MMMIMITSRRRGTTHVYWESVQMELQGTNRNVHWKTSLTKKTNIPQDAQATGSPSLAVSCGHRGTCVCSCSTSGSMDLLCQTTKTLISFDCSYTQHMENPGNK
jgi:hypothetical protein